MGTMRAMAEMGRRHWVNRSLQHYSGWSLLALRAGFCSTLYASGVKGLQALQVLPATDQAGEVVVEAGVEMTGTMIHHHRTITKDGQEKAHMAPTNHNKDGDPAHGLPH